ncbi:MAG: HTH-type transcriptional activator IlvY [Desulfobacterales bacterium]|nr:HTH-type transcriptional activator IlvY [Desulfobacterales bacterium]
MDIRTLELFRHLAGSLHFAKTSRACHITPSALTRVIQRLEAEVGHPLFIRDNRSVELTHAGMAFRQYADDVLLRWEEFHGELSQEEGLSGELSLYCSVTAAYSILPDLITRYRKRHPRVQLKLATGDAAHALEKLISREAEVCIAARSPRMPKGASFLKLAESPLVFIAPRRYPDTVKWIRGRVDWEHTPLIVADTGLSREQLDRWFARQGQLPHIHSQVSGHEAIIALVNLGCGVGFLPRLVLEKSPLRDQVRILPHPPEVEPFEIGLCALAKGLTNPRVTALWELADG